MDNLIKVRWLNALRSGEYVQAQNKLSIDIVPAQRGFCCLGVLCELAVADGVIAPAERGDSYYYDSQDAVLPPRVISWAGVDDDVPDFYMDPADMPKGVDVSNTDWTTNSKGFYYVNLAELNDKGATFAEIADLIEKYF